MTNGALMVVIYRGAAALDISTWRLDRVPEDMAWPGCRRAGLHLLFSIDINQCVSDVKTAEERFHPSRGHGIASCLVEGR